MDEVALLASIEKECIKFSGNKRANESICPQIFDGFMCWPKTPENFIAHLPCNNELLKSTIRGIASKVCGPKGRWAGKDNSSDPWTDYSQCGQFYFEKIVPNQPWDVSVYNMWLPIIKKTTQIGYSFSIICLVLALIVFIGIKRLHCPRNYLHMNLFVSFIIRSFMSLLKDLLFVKGTSLISDTVYINGVPSYKTSWLCKAIISTRLYFIISNYIILLMEGFYLHNLMFMNYFTEKSSVKYYCIVGWVLPLFFIIPWVVLKQLYEDFLCWTQKEDSHIRLLIEVPVGLSVVMNFILFIIIVRVLFVKLNTIYVQQRRIKYRKLLKSTLILLPLFGIPYVISLILSFYANYNIYVEIVWLFFDQSFTAFQGFFTALLYCLSNTEVQFELRRRYYSFMERRNSKEFRRCRTISHTTHNSYPNEDMDSCSIDRKDTRF